MIHLFIASKISLSFNIVRLFARMKYFLIAGEASGDNHAADLIRAIKARDAQAEFAFWGGDAMACASDGIRMHYKEYSIMGFIEVLLQIRKISEMMTRCKSHIMDFKPDVVVLVDFPGFNLRIAEFCKQQSIKVIYYIAPKVWAWKEGRIKKLERFTDKVLLILPFEQAYFSKFNVNAVFVGNPSFEQVDKFISDTKFKEMYLKDNKPLVALLPGSRKQEIRQMLPLMSKMANAYPKYHFLVAGAPSLKEIDYSKYVSENLNVVFGKTYDILANSKAAIVCSGTATLETALFNVPQVCGYKGNIISYFIARMLVKIKYISLVNLCLDKPLIKELIQFDWNQETLQTEFEKILDGQGRIEMLAGYDELKMLLQYARTSDKAAEEVIKILT